MKSKYSKVKKISLFSFIFLFTIAIFINNANALPSVKVSYDNSQSCPSGQFVNGIGRVLLCGTPTGGPGGGSYNSTYDSLIKWGYNQTYSGSTYNATYIGINTSYVKWWYNMTYSGSTYNASYDVCTAYAYNSTVGTYNQYNTQWSSTYNSSYAYLNSSLSITNGKISCKNITQDGTDTDFCADATSAGGMDYTNVALINKTINATGQTIIASIFDTPNCDLNSGLVCSNANVTANFISGIINWTNITETPNTFYETESDIITGNITSWNQTILMPINAYTNYTFDCTYYVLANVTTTGVFLNVSLPASPTTFNIDYNHPTTATAPLFVTCLNTGNSCASLSATSAVTALPVKIHGMIDNGANADNINISARCEIARGLSNVKAGSHCTLVRTGV